jgi:hypothetical protein
MYLLFIKLILLINSNNKQSLLISVKNGNNYNNIKFTDNNLKRK